MNVQAISIVPPTEAKDNYALTPELCAAVLAKFSRSNDGLDTIMKNVDIENSQKSVDNIFKFIDYGHASIGGLTGGIPIVLDGISMFLAYKLFDIAQLTDGQESSTRYITMTKESLLSPEEMGIDDPELAEQYLSVMGEAFDVYNEVYNDLDRLAKEQPELTRIPKDVAPKVRERMLKNYALDRARYFIPFGTKTSAAYIMTARVWADTIKRLESYEVPEFKEAASKIRVELEKYSKNLIRHSHADDNSIYVAKMESDLWFNSDTEYDSEIIGLYDSEHYTQLDDFNHKIDTRYDDYDVLQSVKTKLNRYAQYCHEIKNRTIRFLIKGITIAELRDLNRHRSGHRFSDLNVRGLYISKEVRDMKNPKIDEFLSRYVDLVRNMKDYSYGNELNIIPYSFLLGTQVDFEHTTQLDKFIYEAELRTGLGSHYMYAHHFTCLTMDFIDKNPLFEDYIELGTAEPE